MKNRDVSIFIIQYFVYFAELRIAYG